MELAAQIIAQNILSLQPDSRRQEMIESVKSANPAMWEMVKKELANN